VRLIRVTVYHEGTFRAIVRAALEGIGCFHHDGRFWQPVESGRGCEIYRRAPDYLDWLQQRVEDYEHFFYTRLIHDHCGQDGVLRPRAQLRRGRCGAYRRSEQAAGGAQ
jgi:hypothetical protein